MKVELPDPNEKKDAYISLDPWDSWSADATIAKVAGPVLKQLKETTHSFGVLDQEDVPCHFEEYYKEVYLPFHKGGDINDKLGAEVWEWLLEELVWAMDNIADGNYDGLEEFMVEELPEDKSNWEEYEFLNKFWLNKSAMEAHTKRVDNALRLFGKYFTSLWD